MERRPEINCEYLEQCVMSAVSEAREKGEEAVGMCGCLEDVERIEIIRKIRCILDFNGIVGMHVEFRDELIEVTNEKGEINSNSNGWGFPYLIRESNCEG